MARVSELPTEVLLSMFSELQVAYPAGRYCARRRQRTLGWLTVTHVNRRWRDIALASSPLWASTLCTFYHAQAIQQYLVRSGSAPVIIDLNVLAHNTTCIPFDERVMDCLAERSLFTRSLAIVTSELKHGSQNCFLPTLSGLLSQQTFSFLERLDIFISTSMGDVTPFYAPHLNTLWISTDSLSTEAAPLSFQSLQTIFRGSPRIKDLKLKRAISAENSWTADVVNQTTLSLVNLEVETFNEHLTILLAPYVSFAVDCVVDVTVLSIRKLSTAHVALSDFLQLRPRAIQLYHTMEGDHLDEDSLLPFSLFCEVTLRDGHRTVVYRLPWNNPTWSFDDLARTDLDEVTSLTISEYDLGDDEELPAHLDPSSLLQSLPNLRDLFFYDPSQIALISLVPPSIPLRKLSLQFPALADVQMIRNLRNWVRTRLRTMPKLKIILYGRTSTNIPLDLYMEIESFALNEIGASCVLEDRRVFDKHKTKRTPLLTGDAH